MEKSIEQTLSKPTLQFGLRPADYLVLAAVAIVGNFFLPKLALVVLLAVLVLILRNVNLNKRRFFWSSLYIWIVTNTNLELRQTRKLPSLFEEHRD